MAKAQITMLLFVACIAQSEGAQCLKGAECPAGSDEDTNVMIQTRVVASEMAVETADGKVKPVRQMEHIATTKQQYSNKALASHTKIREPIMAEAWAELADMMTVKSGAPPARNMTRSKELEQMLLTIVMGGLNKSQEYAQTQINSESSTVNSCIKALETQGSNVAQKSVETAAAKQKHADCRTAEASQQTNRTTICNELQAHLPIAFPTVPDPQTPETVRVYFKKMLEEEKKFREKDIACNNTKTRHQDARKKCGVNQASYESHFCEHQVQVLGLDKNVKSCQAHKDTYDELKKRTVAQVDSWGAELKAVKKILCYLDTWLSDNNVSTVNKSFATQCERLNVNLSSVAVQYPSLQTLTVVANVQSVQGYPGTTDFLKNYETLPSKAPRENVIPCFTTTTTTTTTTQASVTKFVGKCAAEAKTCPDQCTGGRYQTWDRKTDKFKCALRVEEWDDWTVSVPADAKTFSFSATWGWWDGNGCGDGKGRITVPACGIDASVSRGTAVVGPFMCDVSSLAGSSLKINHGHTTPCEYLMIGDPMFSSQATTSTTMATTTAQAPTPAKVLSLDDCPLGTRPNGDTRGVNAPLFHEGKCYYFLEAHGSSDARTLGVDGCDQVVPGATMPCISTKAEDDYLKSIVLDKSKCGKCWYNGFTIGNGFDPKCTTSYTSMSNGQVPTQCTYIKQTTGDWVSDGWACNHYTSSLCVYQ
jgi:CxxC motif-containing protein